MYAFIGEQSQIQRRKCNWKGAAQPHLEPTISADVIYAIIGMLRVPSFTQESQ